MAYEELLKYADEEGLIVKEKSLSSYDGRIYQNKIAIRRNIPTLKEKYCVLAEELGHYYTSCGDILDTTDSNNYKQEIRARKWGYEKTVGLIGIINAFESGCRSLYETAEYLNVTELHLREAITWYKSKYGLYTRIDNYIIYFNSGIGIMKYF